MNYSAITFITSNAKKREQVEHYLGRSLEHIALDLPEIQSLDLELVVHEKVKEAYRNLQKPVLVEDISLVFPALGKLPGPLIKWFLQELGNEGLCRLLDSYPHRTAVATVCYGLSDGSQIQLFSGTCTGSIAQHPRGELTFGWNPIFIPQGYAKTWAEMTLDEQANTSIRNTALKKMAHYLETA